VKRGDTRSKIAKCHHVIGGWKAVWKLNKETTKNPNLIFIGQVIKIK
jgi:resuscitation-promoting factor RpfA